MTERGQTVKFADFGSSINIDQKKHICRAYVYVPRFTSRAVRVVFVCVCVEPVMLRT